MAVCIVRDEPFEIVYLRKINLFAHGSQYYKFDPKLIAVMLAKYLSENEATYFSKVGLFVIENQMSRAFFKVQFALEGMLIKYGRAVSVHPSTVKGALKTCSSVPQPLTDRILFQIERFHFKKPGKNLFEGRCVFKLPQITFCGQRWS